MSAVDPDRLAILLDLIDRIEAAHAEEGQTIAELRAQLATPAAPMPVSAAEWLTPGQLAGREGVSEGHVRKVLKLGRARGNPGIRKDGGRWAATHSGFMGARDEGAF